jgi:hypothetical protein
MMHRNHAASPVESIDKTLTTGGRGDQPAFCSARVPLVAIETIRGLAAPKRPVSAP